MPQTAIIIVLDISLQSLCTPLGVSSKLTQIVALYRNKDPGRLSAVTWSIAGYGCYGMVLLMCLVLHFIQPQLYNEKKLVSHYIHYIYTHSAVVGTQ